MRNSRDNFRWKRIITVASIDSEDRKIRKSRKVPSNQKVTLKIQGSAYRDGPNLVRLALRISRLLDNIANITCFLLVTGQNFNRFIFFELLNFYHLELINFIWPDRI